MIVPRGNNYSRQQQLGVRARYGSHRRVSSATIIIIIIIITSAHITTTTTTIAHTSARARVFVRISDA